MYIVRYMIIWNMGYSYYGFVQSQCFVRQFWLTVSNSRALLMFNKKMQKNIINAVRKELRSHADKDVKRAGNDFLKKMCGCMVSKRQL